MMAVEILSLLEDRNLQLAVAESVTGGLLTAEFSKVPGASKVLVAGIVAYDTRMKHELLGVSNSLLENQGAVDPEVVAQMAQGIRAKIATGLGTSSGQIIGIATTGVAGPDEQDGKAVGTVFIGISGFIGGSDEELVFSHHLSGNRQDIQRMTVELALKHLGEQIRG